MSGYRLKSMTTGQPGGWRYQIPETGYTAVSNSYTGLKAKIIKHFVANDLTVPSDIEIERRVNDYLCMNGCDCTYEDVPIVRSSRRSMQISDVAKFTATLVHSLVSGQKVSQEEADRRAGICSMCTSNVKPEGCTGCNSRLLKETVKLVSRHGNTGFDDKLNSCEHCGCFIRSMIWFPIETMHKFTDDSENEQLPAHCWKKR